MLEAISSILLPKSSETLCLPSNDLNSQRELQDSAETMAVELLTQADGYGIICGLSVLFCGIILVAVRIQKRYLAEDSEQSEMFMVANRSVGTGLTCSAVFSSWM